MAKLMVLLPTRQNSAAVLVTNSLRGKTKRDKMEGFLHSSKEMNLQ